MAGDAREVAVDLFELMSRLRLVDEAIEEFDEVSDKELPREISHSMPLLRELFDSLKGASDDKDEWAKAIAACERKLQHNIVLVYLNCCAENKKQAYAILNGDYTKFVLSRGSSDPIGVKARTLKDIKKFINDQIKVASTSKDNLERDHITLEFFCSILRDCNADLTAIRKEMLILIGESKKDKRDESRLRWSRISGVLGIIALISGVFYFFAEHMGWVNLLPRIGPK